MALFCPSVYKKRATSNRRVNELNRVEEWLLVALRCVMVLKFPLLYIRDI
jgi:hypothetical protein